VIARCGSPSWADPSTAFMGSAASSATYDLVRYHLADG
jgi:hypothetical protein